MTMKSSQSALCCGTARERGQSLTEMALLLPVLVMLVIGAIDLGRAYFAYVGITNAAREGARAGMDNPTPTYFGDCATVRTIRYAVCQELNGSGIVIANPGTDITIECSAVASPDSYSSGNCSNPQAGGRIRVMVQYNFNFISTQVIGLNSMTMRNWDSMVITNGCQPGTTGCP